MREKEIQEREREERERRGMERPTGKQTGRQTDRENSQLLVSSQNVPLNIPFYPECH